jgi:hypothetical protein
VDEFRSRNVISIAYQADLSRSFGPFDASDDGIHQVLNV